MKQKIILFGGTFDPPHNGHMCLLSAAVKEVQPDLVIVMPTGTPPHKQAGHTRAELRLAMCGCFLQLFHNIIISDDEIVQGGKSYTVNTLKRLHEKYSDAQIFLPVGSDMLLSFTEWKSWREILSLAVLVVHCRKTDDITPVQEYVKMLKHEGGDVIIAAGKIETVSSTLIRDMAASGQDISGLVPSAAEEIITQNNLYKV